MYKVLAKGVDKDFKSHGQAFGHCQLLTAYPKGVYSVAGDTLTPINVWASFFTAEAAALTEGYKLRVG